MIKWNKVFGIVLLACFLLVSLAACGDEKKDSVKTDGESEEKISIVTTIFPQYDFLRQIVGDKVDLKMLVKPGSEVHSFEPTPQEIKDVGKAKMFVYVGGDSDKWVDSILDTVDKDKMKIITLMDCVDLVEEEAIEGMTAEEEEEEAEGEVEYDEHVWTSPKNAKIIVQKLCDGLCEIDPDEASYYKENTKKYLEKLDALDKEFQDVVDQAKRKEIIVGDRFPFRYFVDAYGLKYYAAFPGCATDTEPSASTIAFLTDKVKEDSIPVVFHIEMSNGKVCDSICEATGAKSELLNAVHIVSKDDFEGGATYIDLMEKNVTALKEALN